VRGEYGSPGGLARLDGRKLAVERLAELPRLIRQQGFDVANKMIEGMMCNFIII
jgi:hypothetical protein